MAAVNLGISLVALALLPMALDSWSSDAAGYGLATGVLGFAALGAPLLRRIGATPVVSMRRGLFLVALGVLLVVPAPSIGWALVPLALAGAAAVSVEAAATSVLQEEVSDEVRASVFGLNDSVIVAAALVGSLMAPVSVEAGRRRTRPHRHRRRPRARGVVRQGVDGHSQPPATVGGQREGDR